MGQNFVEFALSGMVFEIQAFLCFAIFAKNSKGPPFFWRDKYFLKTDTLWVKNFAEIPLVNFDFMKKMVSKSIANLISKLDECFC